MVTGSIKGSSPGAVPASLWRSGKKASVLWLDEMERGKGRLMVFGRTSKARPERVSALYLGIHAYTIKGDTFLKSTEKGQIALFPAHPRANFQHETKRALGAPAERTQETGRGGSASVGPRCGRQSRAGASLIDLDQSPIAENSAML
jgi:hypothetical protein